MLSKQAEDMLNDKFKKVDEKNEKVGKDVLVLKESVSLLKVTVDELSRKVAQIISQIKENKSVERVENKSKLQKAVDKKRGY